MAATSPLISSDYMEIVVGDKVPAKGIVLQGTAVYDDGEFVGVLHSDMPRHAAIEWVLDGHGEAVYVYWRPLEAGAAE